MAQQASVGLVSQSPMFCQHIQDVYKPLESALTQLRLMHIEPGPFENLHINVTLSVADLDNPPEYDALSYTWGCLTQTIKISLHGVPFEVTENQYAALRRLRLPDRQKTIWIDATCINQADQAERSSQVSIMGKIYAGASQTHVWLGEPQKSWFEVDDDAWKDHMDWYRSEPALPDYMTQCAKSRPEGISHRFREAVSQRHDGALAGALCILELLAEDVPLQCLPFCELDPMGEVVHIRVFYEALEMLLSILEQPWWTRVWVVQEICMSRFAPVVHIGNRELSLNLFRKASQGLTNSWSRCQWVDNCLKFVFKISALLDEFNHLLSYFVTMEESAHRIGSLSLASALDLVEGRGATDRRDFIFGILSIVREELRIPVDYSLTNGEVFAEASWISYSGHRRGFDSLKDAAGVKAKDMPSWAIDWSSVKTTHFGHSELFTTKNDESDDLEGYYPEVGVLQIGANKLDAIDIVLATPKEPFDSAGGRDIDAMIGWMSQLLTLGFISESDLLDDNSVAIADFFITMFREARTVAEHNMKLFRYNQDWSGFLKWYLQLKQLIETGNDVALYSAAKTASVTDLQHSLDDSVLCITKSGRLCLARESVKQGDYLYHIKGCGVPLALRFAGSMQWRETYDEEEYAIETYRVVGPCYVRGLMGVDGVDPATDQILYLV